MGHWLDCPNALAPLPLRPGSLPTCCTAQVGSSGPGTNILLLLGQQKPKPADAPLARSYYLPVAMISFAVASPSLFSE
jgi:hypothetical protein